MLEKLKEIIADQLNVDAATITPESRFKEDLEADSLDLLNLLCLWKKSTVLRFLLKILRRFLP